MMFFFYSISMAKGLVARWSREAILDSLLLLSAGLLLIGLPGISLSGHVPLFAFRSQCAVLLFSSNLGCVPSHPSDFRRLLSTFNRGKSV